MLSFFFLFHSQHSFFLPFIKGIVFTRNAKNSFTASFFSYKCDVKCQKKRSRKVCYIIFFINVEDNVCKWTYMKLLCKYVYLISASARRFSCMFNQCSYRYPNLLSLLFIIFIRTAEKRSYVRTMNVLTCWFRYDNQCSACTQPFTSE